MATDTAEAASETSSVPTLADASAVLGAVCWCVLFVAGRLEPIQASVALALLVSVPLAIRVVDTPRRDGTRSMWYRFAVLSQPVAALFGVVSLTTSPGQWAFLAALPWAASMASVAGFGAWRLLGRGPWPVEELVVDAGLLSVLFAGGALLFDRAGFSVVSQTTVAQVLHVGALLPIVVGLTRRYSAGRQRRSWFGGTVAVLTVAAGLAWLVSGLVDGIDTESFGLLLASHGLTVVALVGWRLDIPQSRARPPGILLSRIRGGWNIGAGFLERRGKTGDADVSGMMGTVEAYSTDKFDPDTVAPSVRRFFERSGEYELAVDPNWALPWRRLAVLYRPVATRMQQLSVPLVAVDDTAALSGRVVAVDSTDEATGDRAWVRSNSNRDQVPTEARMTYVGVYDQYDGPNRSFLRVAFPLPGCNLSGVLRVENGGSDSDALVLSSFAAPGNTDDAGLYLAVRGFGVRLPLDETLVVEPAESEGVVTATHRVETLGMRVFTLQYRIRLGAE
ncbi:YndJ family transporter [Haloarchaeobius sp. DFWS5]|uniref:YndJ family transporter n=1 Tax=Haloarchaeobius sp. DFWS5 TaxID=3446114 RepID=UPI003EBB7F5F